MNIGDKTAQDRIRAQRSNESHCAWLRRDSNACESLPSGVEGTHEGVQIVPGMVCPHNVYSTHPDVFEHRTAVEGTIERIFRLIGAADLGLLTESDLNTLTITELLTAKAELNRQQIQRDAKNRAKASLEAEVNKDRERLRPGVMGS